ncbi:hypothetical protein H3U21_19490, partial [Clostridioides difficile]|nr:hypothetical protein [Clostridioides difficile]
PSDDTYVLTLTKGTAKDGDIKANVEVTGLPSGLDYTAEGDSSANTITITVSGTASQAVQTDLDNVSVLVKAGAVSETTATDSAANATFEVKKYVAAPAVGQLTFDATDKQIKMASGDKTVDPSDDTYVLTLTKGTAKDGDIKANVEVTGLPSGLDYTAEGDSSANTITITVSGTASQAVQTDLDNVSVLVKAGAVSETTATDSAANATFEVKKYVAAPAVGQLTFDATDKQIKMASGDKTVDPSDDTYVLTLTKGTAKDGDVKANVEVTGLPSGLDYTAEGDSSANTITITVSGTASQAVQTDLDNVSVLVKAGAVSETTATDSAANATFEVKKYVAPAIGQLTFDA